MLLRRLALVGVVLTVVGIGAGCGPDKPRKTTTPSGMGGAPPTGGDAYGVPGEGEIGGPDESTGDAVPTGPGEEVPTDHVMSADAKGIYNEGVQAAANRHLDKAEQAFRRVLQIDGRAHQAAYNLGVVADRRGDSDGARNYFRQALGLQPNYLPAISALANLEIRGGNVEAGVGLLQAKANAYPQDLGILNRYADVLIIARRYNDAIAVAKQALRIDERNAEAMLRVGKANLRLGRFELANSVFDQVLAINPDEAEVYFLRSFIALQDGFKAEAIKSLQATLEKQPDHVEAMNNLAAQYLLSGNYAAAIEQLERALQLAPSWGALHLNYGNALRGAGQWKEAKISLERARALDHSLIGALFNLGVLYYTADELDNLDRLGRLGEARRLFAQYKAEMGSALAKDDQVYKYLKEVDISVEREERRIQQLKEREALEAERAKEREAAEAAKAAGGGEEGGAGEGEEGGGGGDEWKDDDEGWQ